MTSTPLVRLGVFLGIVWSLVSVALAIATDLGVTAFWIVAVLAAPLDVYLLRLSGSRTYEAPDLPPRRQKKSRRSNAKTAGRKGPEEASRGVAEPPQAATAQGGSAELGSRRPDDSPHKRSDRPTSPGPSDLNALTRRELELIESVAAGLSNAEIAERLFVTRATVEAHLERIYAKLGVSHRAELAVLVGQGDAPENDTTPPA